MDRKNIQKIGNVILVLAAVLLVSFSALFCIRENARLTEKQKEEFTTVYQEREAELAEICQYYDKKQRENMVNFFLFAGGVVLFSAVFLEFQIRVRERKFSQCLIKNLHLFEEQLNQFLQGNYEIREEAECEGVDKETGLAMQEMGERISGLGKYFSMLREKLEQEENSTKSLITDISHQLKTPLAAVRLNYEMMQEDCLTEEERREFLEREEQEIDKLESLLEELMKLSRLESHMIQLKRERVNLKDLILEAINQVYMKAHSREIEIQADIPGDLWLSMDKKWTVEAFVNVLDNAIKYSLPKGVVKVRVTAWNNMASLEIEDEGIGISSQERHKIFHRFYRGEKALEMVKEGAGVGLYLTRQIIEEQGGTILAKRKRKGTVFQITMQM